MTDSRDLAIGVAAVGVRSGFAAGRIAMLPARAALRAPVAGPPLRRSVEDLARRGRLARSRALAELESTATRVLSSPEVERVAARVLETADLDRIVGVVLEHERTEQVIVSALASPGLERLIVQLLDSRLADEVTDRVLHSPEMERVVEYVATSPQVLDAVSRQTRSFADEMASGARRRAESADDLVERTVRGWLRRPRPQPS
jgi:hypothetical protein